MRYWLQLPQGGWVANRENVRLYALLAEELGFHGVWLGDHIVIPVDYASQYPYGELHPVPADRPFLEAYTTLAYVAGMTRRVRLAITVAIAPYRHPLYHAKVAATLDVLSGGRLEIAVGTGWLKEEFDALGADYARRGRVTDEYLDVMHRLWTGEPVAFHGETVSFDTVQCLPRPSQRPHPPLWIGGAGARAFARMQRLNAGWLGPDLPVREYLNKLEQFTESCMQMDGSRPSVSAKVWLEPPQSRQDDSLSVGVTGKTNLALFERLARAGTTEIRIDLSRLPSRERPAHIHALSRALRQGGGLYDE